MIRRPSKLQCGVLAGLALLCADAGFADDALRNAVRERLRDENYVLVEWHDGARLYLLSTDTQGGTLSELARRPHGGPDAAIAMTQSADAKARVRGLTLLAGDIDVAARDAALALLSDPVPAVREEAYLLLFEHPHADTYGIATLALADKSARVREAVEELLSEQAAD